MPQMPTRDDRPTLALRLRETAKALSVSPRSLSQWVKEGRIPHVRIGRTLMFPVVELQRWLASQAAGTTPETGATGGVAFLAESRPAERR